jgi:hypothetical protein
MAGKLSWEAWRLLLQSNREWLEQQDRTLERDHLVAIVDDLLTQPAGRAYYDALPAPKGA